MVRDSEGNMITVCFIENIDPLGVHTGDSFCSAPMLTISEEVQKRLQEKSHKVVDSVKVIGGCNVQWAHDPKQTEISLSKLTQEHRVRRHLLLKRQVSRLLWYQQCWQQGLH